MLIKSGKLVARSYNDISQNGFEIVYDGKQVAICSEWVRITDALFTLYCENYLRLSEKTTSLKGFLPALMQMAWDIDFDVAKRLKTSGYEFKDNTFECKITQMPSGNYELYGSLRQRHEVSGVVYRVGQTKHAEIQSLQKTLHQMKSNLHNNVVLTGVSNIAKEWVYQHSEVTVLADGNVRLVPISTDK